MAVGWGLWLLEEIVERKMCLSGLELVDFTERVFSFSLILVFPSAIRVQVNTRTHKKNAVNLPLPINDVHERFLSPWGGSSVIFEG